MSTAKATIGNNSYIGAFAVATDSFALITVGATATERRIVEETLKVRSVGMTVDGSGLVGVYAAANSKGVLLPETADQAEVARLRKELPGVEVGTVSTSLNALRNNILANDSVAFVNHEFSRKEAERISEVLGVEAIGTRIGPFETIGASNILTNRGMVVNNGASDEALSFVRKRIASVSQSTANLGSPSIGLCTIANSNGVVVGGQTTGFEIARIEEGLDL